MPTKIRLCPSFLAVLWILFYTPPTLAVAAKEPQLLLPTGEQLDTLQRLHAISLGHIALLTYSHDGKLLATGEEDGRICVWDMASARPIRCLPRTDARRVTALAFEPRDSWVVLGHTDGSIDLRGTARERAGEPCHLEALPDKLSFGRSITTLLFSPKTDSLLAFGAKGGTGRLWRSPVSSGTCGSAKDLAWTELAAPSQLPVGLFEATALDPTGQRLAISIGTAVGVWAANTGERQWLEDKLPAPAISLAISPDGRYLAAGLLDGGIRLFEVESGRMRLLGSPHNKAIRTIVFSPGGRSLAAGSDDSHISIWDLPSARSPRILVRRSGITALAFSPNGAFLAAASEDVGITIWNTATDDEALTLRGNADRIRSVAFNQPGTLMATVSDDQEVRVWQRGQGTEPAWSLRCRTGPQDGILRAVAFDPPAGRLLAVAGDSRMIRLFRSADCIQDGGRQLQDSNPNGTWRKGLAFSPDGCWLATASDAGTVAVWDIKRRERKTLLSGHRDAVLAVAFSPQDSTLLATGSHDKTIRLWNVVSGKLLHSSEPQSASIRSLAFSPDGRTLATAADKVVSLWDTRDFKDLGNLPHDDGVSAVRFNTDGRLIATAERKGRLRLWELVWQKQLVATPPQDNDTSESVLAIAVDPKDDSLASAVLGRVQFRRLHSSQTVHTVLWQGRQGWAAWTAAQGGGGTLFRNDVGGLLWQRESGGELKPLEPPRPHHDPQLELSVTLARTSPWAPGTLIATVNNKPPAGPALWMRWEMTTKPAEHDLQERFSFRLPEDHMRLEAGDKVPPFVIPISLRSRWLLWPRRCELCLTVHPLYGSPRTVCQEIAIGPWWWLRGPEILMILLVGGSLFGIGWWFMRQRVALTHPVALAVRAGKNPLADRPLHDYPAVEEVLCRAEASMWTRGLRYRVLSAAGIDQPRWHRVLEVFRSEASCAAQLAECVLAQLDDPIRPLFWNSEVAVFRITLPSLSIYVSEHCVLIVCMSRSVPLQTSLTRCRSRDLGNARFALVVDLTSMQAAPVDIKPALIEAHGGTIFVILSESQLRRILFAENAQQAKAILRVAIIQQCEIEQILPYQEGNGIEDDKQSFFFGRGSELARMLNRHRQNFLLVGPRQMGKSSLLNALRRELLRRHPSVKVLKFQLSNGSLRAISKVDPSLRADTPEAFYDSVMDRTPEHQIFLLDEADEFVKHEQRTQYSFCNVMRALSGQGRASFILAGHQELHDAVRTADHPLRNFGELLRLAPLDLQSAQRMILEPITALELHLSDETATVDWLRTQTACRPYLLAQACSAIVHLRKPLSPKPILFEEVRAAVLSNASLRDTFGNWETATGQSIVDCVVIRAALLLEKSTLSDLRMFLFEQGADLSTEEIDRSVSRLYVLHYALVADANGVLTCPLPLFRHFLSHPHLDMPRGFTWSSPIERLRRELIRDIAALGRPPIRSFREPSS